MFNSIQFKCMCEFNIFIQMEPNFHKIDLFFPFVYNLHSIVIKFKKCGINPLHPPNVRDKPKQREIMQGVGEFLGASIVVIEVYVNLMDLHVSKTCTFQHYTIFFSSMTHLLFYPNLTC
jgi:hypothetical protein